MLQLGAELPFQWESQPSPRTHSLSSAKFTAAFLVICMKKEEEAYLTVSSDRKYIVEGLSGIFQDRLAQAGV